MMRDLPDPVPAVPDPVAALPTARQGVVAVVIRDGRFLMIKRAEGLLAGGAWCFVGGGIEPDESQPAAIEREFVEEVGGRIRALRKIWEFTRPDGALVLHWWLVELVSDAFAANPHEVQELRWCSLDEIRALDWVLESNHKFLDLVAEQLLAERSEH